MNESSFCLAGRGYSFGVMVVFNFVLFLLCVYWSVHKNPKTADSTRKSQDAIIARHPISVSVTCILCWFPIGLGLCGFPARENVPISLRGGSELEHIQYQ